MIEIHNFTHRLGNQLFQLAAAIGLAYRSNDNVLFPDWKYAQFFNGNFNKINGIQPGIYWSEPSFDYTSIPLNTTIINGYYQSDKYFRHCSKDIRSMFSIKDNLIEKVVCRYHDLLQRNNVVGVHVRRGDYLGLPNHHPVLGLDYFLNAVSQFPKDSIFLVFSDDTDWCKENFPLLNEKFFVVEGQSDIEDFTLMTLCDHYCISNSTFSWWPAWLNSSCDKIVVAPSKWFGPAYSNFDTKDLYCDEWVKL